MGSCVRCLTRFGSIVHTTQVLFMLGQHLPALLDKTERGFWLAHVYPALVLLSLESGLPQLQVRPLAGWWW